VTGGRHNVRVECYERIGDARGRPAHPDADGHTHLNANPHFSYPSLTFF
jgi:hypothetical protein